MRSVYNVNIDLGISKVKDQFVVRIDDRLGIHKTIFTFRTNIFTPVLSLEEHSGYQWVKHTDVERQLFYQSNKATWTFVLAREFRRASNDRNPLKEITGNLKNTPHRMAKI